MSRVLGAIAVLAVLAAPGRAQLSPEVSVGAVWSSPLVEDVIVNPITVQPQIAPSVAVSVGAPLDARHRVAGRIRWGRSDLRRHEAGEASSVLPLTVWTATGVLERRLWRRVAAELSFGATKYDPGGNADGTIFQDGAPLQATLGVGVRASRPIAERLTLGVHLGYDLHQLQTAALRSAGFTGSSLVHRISLSVVLRWGEANATAS